MKRYFYFDGSLKEAPPALKETPAIKSHVACHGALYEVVEVLYKLEKKEVIITLFEIKRLEYGGK
jgi:hypothetical protein